MAQVYNKAKIFSIQPDPNNYYSNTDTRTAKREQRYTVVPKPTKDYNEDNVIDTDDTPFIEPGDDFGFTETSSFFGDGKEYNPARNQDL